MKLTRSLSTLILISLAFTSVPSREHTEMFPLNKPHSDDWSPATSKLDLHNKNVWLCREHWTCYIFFSVGDVQQTLVRLTARALRSKSFMMDEQTRNWQDVDWRDWKREAWSGGRLWKSICPNAKRHFSHCVFLWRSHSNWYKAIQ